MGAPGPDKGKGGKYLILTTGYKGKVPSGYFVARTPSNVKWLVLRGFLMDGKTDPATKIYRDGVKMYPLAKAKPAMKFINGSTKPFNVIHANNSLFYEELAPM